MHQLYVDWIERNALPNPRRIVKVIYTNNNIPPPLPHNASNILK